MRESMHVSTASPPGGRPGDAGVVEVRGVPAVRLYQVVEHRSVSVGGRGVAE